VSSTVSTSSKDPYGAPDALLNWIWKPLIPLLSSAPSLTKEDLMTFYFDDSIKYYTTELRPQLVDGPIANHPRTFSKKDWIEVPRMLRHSLIYSIASHRIARGHTDQAIKSRMYEHRGHAMEMLRHHLTCVSTAPIWYALVLIIVLLGNEINLSGTGNWHVHLDTAWQLIGAYMSDESQPAPSLQQAWASGMEPKIALTFLLQVEILSATTSPIDSLGVRPGMLQLLRSRSLKDMEQWLLVSSCPCPIPVLQCLGDIADLRTALHNTRLISSTSPSCLSEDTAARDTPPQVPTETACSQRIWTLTTDLLYFDTPSWSHRLYTDHAPFPPGSFQASHPKLWREAWAHLGSAYRSAAIIYTVHALREVLSPISNSASSPSSSHVSRPAVDSACRAFLLDETTDTDPSSLLAQHRVQLARDLDVLVGEDGLLDVRNPLVSEATMGTRPNVRKFVGWPLFVQAYDAVAWAPDDIPTTSSTCSVIEGGAKMKQRASPDHGWERSVQRLRTIARLVGSNVFHEAADILAGIAERRAEFGPAGIWRREWRWDWHGAFAQRCCFAF
jgi:hypothetical protein